eukprot:4244277-Pyramimonas_sp.AAC.1
MLEGLGLRLHQRTLPWVLGCDANMQPDDPGLVQWCAIVGATILAPRCKTCTAGKGSTLDLFVVSRGLGSCVSNLRA